MISIMNMRIQQYIKSKRNQIILLNNSECLQSDLPDQINDLDHSLIGIWLIFSPKELIMIWLIFLMIEWSRSDHFFEKTTPCFFQSFMKSKICFYIELILYINFNFILIYEIFFVNWNWKLKWNCLVQPEWNWKSVSIECSTFKKIIL